MLLKISLVLLALLSHVDAERSTLELLERVGFEMSEPTLDAGEAVATVQIDLLPDYEGAEARAAALREQLAAAGSELLVFVEIIPGDIELPPSYRVGVGPFSDFEDAERAKIALEGLGFDGFVRELDATLGC